MADLSHWDFADRFSGYDASALILGLEPRESADDAHRVRVVMERMMLDYLETLEEIRWGSPSFDGSSSDIDNPGNMFVSVALEKVIWLHHGGVQTPLQSWIDDPRKSRFDNQEFARDKIVWWLKKVGQKSIYQFESSTEDDEGKKGGLCELDKPVSTKERNTLLSIIAVLCKEAKLDYTKPSKTAGLIQSTAEQMGVSLGETTIEGHLKKVPAALAARTK